jgi:Na+/H+ antiporter
MSPFSLVLIISLMQSLFIQCIFLILIILALVMFANKIKVAYPIVVLLGGLLVSFTSAFSNLTIDPELVFSIFLPPLLYEAAWLISWKEFYKWRRVITSFAFPIVILTSCIIAFVARALIPGFTLALGFLLGAIISPPDAVSATTIMRGVKVPKSLRSIIEGESLLNDASSLIIFRFALVAVITRQFDFGEAASSFFLVIGIGTLIGLFIGAIFYAIHRLLPTTSGIETILSLVAPYCMYYAAEHFHFSGVLAVVSGGLLLSSKRQRMLNYRSRIEGINVWTNLVFVLNGFIFLLIGLQLPSITHQLGYISLGTAIWYGLAISFVLIITRLACTLGASFFTRFMSNFITVADPNPGFKSPLVLGWAGMRGVVSLAAALSIPLVIAAGQPFPFRNLILFITFIVILITLVFQGLTLPWLIRKVKLEDKYQLIPGEQQEIIIQKKIANISLQLLEEKYGKEREQNQHLRQLFSRFQADKDLFDEAVKSTDNKTLRSYHQIYLELLEHQRTLLNNMNTHAEFDEDLIRKYLSLIDLEELKLREKIQ